MIMVKIINSYNNNKKKGNSNKKIVNRNSKWKQTLRKMNKIRKITMKMRM